MKPVVIASLFVVFVAAVVGFAADGLPDKKSNNAQYWVEMDNAFGMITGGDLKIAGVRAGQVTNVELDQRTLRARVGFRITQNGFGDLRRDVHCESRPQSLIGEYFLDCDPGTSPQRIPKGYVIPVSQTSSTVPPDLVNDVLRRPQSERLSLILDFFGAGLAGNGRNLNDTIRRGVPALRETDRVLKILGDQGTVIRNLNQHADVVLQQLANDRKDVGNWVIKARNAARDSAERRVDIARGFHLLPTFLRELRPTMAKLGEAADAQTPALRTLDQNAPQLKRFFTDLKPFSRASQPAFRALGQASKTGSEAVPAAIPVVKQLGAFAKGAPELSKNLAIVLEHLDDRKYAAEYDKRANQQQGVSGNTGYSGLEALLQYVLDQATSTNLYDGSTHILNVQAVDSPQCAPYHDSTTVKGDTQDRKDLRAQCMASLGPTAPGILGPDSTEQDAQARQITYQSPTGPVPPAVAQSRKRSDNAPAPPPVAQVSVPTSSSAQPTQDAPAKHDSHVDTPAGPLGIPDPSQVLPPGTPQVPPPPPVGLGQNSTDSRTQTDLLDYLLH
jgi:ABC-type transporter Mla subunit MlaD